MNFSKENTDKDFEKEFEFSFSRSGGPGGQHVNKTETQVELRFHVENSKLLSDEEKLLIKNKLENKINDEGYLQIFVQESRSQFKNKELAQDKFYELITSALKKEKKRKRTKPTRSSIEKRILNKKKQSEKKQTRSKPQL